MSIPELTRITLYPIKALDGVDVPETTILTGGALSGDREFALFDPKGKFVNGKNNPKVHQLRSRFDLASRTLQLMQGTENHQTFQLDRDRDALINWLSHYFDIPVQLQQNSHIGFPDDTISPGPTAIGLSTYQEIVSWFPELSLDQIRQRFRANLEISNVPPFWEDRLFGEEGQIVQFQIGEVRFAGVNPCQRCIVPTRDPQTGKAYPRFQKRFITKRKETLPEWAAASRFNHFYRLSVNTRIPESEAGKRLRLGDRVTILSSN